MKLLKLILSLVFIMQFNNLNSQTVKTIRIGTQDWMATNLKIDVKGSCSYNYNETFGTKYGKLYTWDAAKNACPAGFRLPTTADWDKLIASLGGEDKAGNELRIGGSSGFNAPLAGMSTIQGFNLIDFYGAFWSADSYDQNHAWYYYIRQSDGIVTKTYFSKNYGFSVRCIKM